MSLEGAIYSLVSSNAASLAPKSSRTNERKGSSGERYMLCKRLKWQAVIEVVDTRRGPPEQEYGSREDI